MNVLANLCYLLLAAQGHGLCWEAALSAPVRGPERREYRQTNRSDDVIAQQTNNNGTTSKVHRTCNGSISNCSDSSGR